MLRKVLKRILISIPVLVGVVLLIFIMLRIVPGDPVTTMMGEHVNPAVIEKISKEMGLDKPLYVQFLQYIAHALRGGFRNILPAEPECDKDYSGGIPEHGEIVSAGGCSGLDHWYCGRHHCGSAAE